MKCTFSRSLLGLSLPSLLLTVCSCDSGTGRLEEAIPFPPPGEEPAFPLLDHVDQFQIRDGLIPFSELFVAGDELFEVEFNSLDGVGALKLPDGTPLPGRFSRIPPGGGRVTGPNGQSCTTCHNNPFGTAGGEAALNVLQDPSRTGQGPFNTRNTTSLFGSAVLQRLAEEITEELHIQRDLGASAAQPGGPPVVVSLEAKGVHYGDITITKDASGEVMIDTSALTAIDPDLVVRPYGWKGDFPTLRGFARDAALNEMGMEPDELVAKDPLGRTDPDCDGVEGELSVGDITAITLYIGAQEIPQTRSRLVQMGLLPPPSPEESRLARRGAILFGDIGCATCHVPELILDDPVFEEPTLRGLGHYIDPEIDPSATGLDPQSPARFHLVQEGDFPRLVPHPSGGARVALLGDLRRHNMGRQLADPVPTAVKGGDGNPVRFEGQELRVDRFFFLTAELWGVGNTGPWLHDGRASSLEEAILLHGEDMPPPPGDPERSEAQEARDAFAALPEEDRLAVVEFLRSLLHFALEEEGEE